ncbi:MAG: LptF/LptG family permease [Bacteroidota bacterium]
MNLLDAYIIKRYLGSFFFILGIVLLICVVVDFNEKIDDFIDKKPPVEEVIFDYYLNFIPFYGNLLAPICIFLAVIFFTSQMAQRTELIPVLSSGVSFYRVLAPYIVTAFFLAGLAFLLKAYVVPVTTERQLDFEHKYFKKRRISSNKNIHKKVAHDTFVFISYYNEKKQEGHTFSLERIENGDIVTKIQADRMKWVDSTQNWVLKKVRRRDIKDSKEVLSFYQELDTTFLLRPGDIFIREGKQASLTLPELLSYIEEEELRGSDFLTELYVEKNRRYADPVAIIILTMIGFAMSSKKSRGGIALQIGLGLLICFIYITLLFAGQALTGDLYTPGMAVWTPNFIFFPIALLLLRLAPK